MEVALELRLEGARRLQSWERALLAEGITIAKALK